MSTSHITFNEAEPKRLDQYLSEYQPLLSRSYITKQIINKKITVNNQEIKAGYNLKSKDKIKIYDSVLTISKPKSIELPIIYEDDFCIVINKPSGVITHAKGIINEECSVASFISDKISSNLEGNRAGIVHRLDRGTSGVIITAKTTQAQIYLQRQFAKRQTKKTYIAIVNSPLKQPQAIINMPLERNPRHPSTFRVGYHGKPAETTYKVLASNINYSLVELKPTTGRTHQLRVHLKAIGHPIVGDQFYDGEPSDRLMLHASTLEVILPDKGRVSFKADIPTAFNNFVTYNYD